ncbi:MAG: peptidylprolyl isomerase [Nannocystaceae bacterium]
MRTCRGPSQQRIAAWVGVASLALACAQSQGPRAFPPPIPELVAANEAAGDPHGGRFSYEEAMAGVPGEGPPVAVIETSAGTLTCRLEPENAPIAVASFVGLARGVRPFRAAAGEPWVTAPYYDGLPWHRAIEGQFVQGGERGPESPGYRLQDEISPGAKFDRAGALAVANDGSRDSGAAEFFISSAELPHLNGKHTIFGTCDAPHVVRELERQVKARPDDPPTITRITIRR